MCLACLPSLVDWASRKVAFPLVGQGPAPLPSVATERVLQTLSC